MSEKPIANGNHVYQLAPQREEFIYERGAPILKEKGRGCLAKCALSSCLLGFVFMIGAGVSALLMKPFVHNQIEENLVILPETQTLSNWKDPPVSPVMNVYFYNLTNKDDFLSGTSKPVVQRIGPYVYFQEIHKVNVSFGDEGETVTFSDNKTYFFSPQLSNGSQSDLIVMPNIPFLGAMNKLSSMAIIRSVFLNLLDSYQFGVDKEPFVTMSVSEYLWGYQSLVITMKELEECESSKVKSFASNDDFDEDWDSWVDEEEEEMETQESSKDCKIDPENLELFGFFHGTNQTVRDQRTVHTGKNDLRLKGLFARVGGSERISWWPDDRCNQLDGRDPGTLTVNLSKKEDMRLYFPNMCRRINFRYVKSVEHEGVQTYRFSPSEDTFNNGSITPINSCYYRPGVAHPSGIFDLSLGCKENSPVLMSWPNFLYGDPILRESVDGIPPPNREADSFQLDIEPRWGITLAARARFQMNVRLDSSLHPGFSNITGSIYLPFLALDEGVPGPNQKVMQFMNLLLNIGDNVKNLSVLGGFALGLLLMLPEIIIWIRSCCSNNEIYTVKKI